MIAGNDLRATVPPIIILLRSHERRITLFTSKLEVPYRNRKALISPSYPPIDSGVMVWGGLFGAFTPLAHSNAFVMVAEVLNYHLSVTFFPSARPNECYFGHA